MQEYAKHCSHNCQPGVGDAFFKFIYDNQHKGQKVTRVSLEEASDFQQGFVNLPKSNLDKDDHKFLAVAEAVKGCVVNAVDSDWGLHASVVKRLRVRVIELMPLGTEDKSTPENAK